jgi:hypothetical protein
MKNLNSSLLTLAVGLAVAACGGDSGTSSSGDGVIPAGPPSGTPDPNVPTDPLGQDPATGGNFLNDVPGVVQRIQQNLRVDAIPALTDPDFVDINSSDADYVFDDDLVLGLFINGEAKAYPHNIGWLHEITNDVVGGKPVVVSFCPLTGTGMVFDGGELSVDRLTCGVSGNLFNNNLVMYDRRDNLSNPTLYPQMMGLGVFGPRTGNELALLPVVETTWRYWKKLHPDTKVIGSNQPRSAGNLGQYDVRTYQRYPYGNYRDPQTEPFFSTWPSLRDNPIRNLFNNKDAVLGVRFDQLAKAYPFRSMDAEEVINDTVGNDDIVVVYYAAEELAIPYFREFKGRSLTFDRVTSLNLAVFPFMMRDQESGTTWDLLGRGVDGPNAGQQLVQVPAHNAFGFAWSTFWQNTGIL